MRLQSVASLVFLGACAAGWIVATVLDVLTPATPAPDTADSDVRHAAQDSPPAAADTSLGTHHNHARESKETAYGLSACEEKAFRTHDQAGARTRPRAASDPQDEPGARGWPFLVHRPFVVRRVSHGAPHTSGRIEVDELVPLFTMPLGREDLN